MMTLGEGFSVQETLKSYQILPQKCLCDKKITLYDIMKVMLIFSLGACNSDQNLLVELLFFLTSLNIPCQTLMSWNVLAHYVGLLTLLILMGWSHDILPNITG
jgi:hypothetical protein